MKLKTIITTALSCLFGLQTIAVDKSLLKSNALNYQTHYLMMTAPPPPSQYGFISSGSLTQCENFNSSTPAELTTLNFSSISRPNGHDQCVGGLSPNLPLASDASVQNLAIVNGSPNGWILPFDVSNGGGHSLRVGEGIPNIGDGFFMVRKKFTPTASGPLTINFDYLPVFHEKNNWDPGYIAFNVERISPPLDMAFQCFLPPSWFSLPNWTYTQLNGDTFKWKDWSNNSITIDVNAGFEYFIDFAASKCEGNDDTFLYIDDLCITESEPDIELTIDEINDNGCEETKIYGTIKTFNNTYSFLPSSFVSKTFVNNSLFSTATTTDPGFSSSFTIVNNYTIEFEIILDNSMSFLPTLGGYDIYVSVEFENNSGTVFTVYDPTLYSGTNNDGNAHCCECGHFDLANITYHGNPFSLITDFTNGQTLTDDIHVDQTVTFRFPYDCEDVLCDMSFEDYSTTLTGNISTSISGNNLIIEYTGDVNDVNGLQTLTVIPKCGPNECQEAYTVYFNVGHCACTNEPQIELISSSTNTVSYSSSLSNFGSGGSLPIICGQNDLITITSPCEGCYDCTAFDVIDHNLPNADFFYNIKTKTYEISFNVEGHCYEDISENYFINLKSNCGTSNCGVINLEFEDCYSNYPTSECLEVFGKKLVESNPGSGVYDILEFGLINNASQLTFASPGDPGNYPVYASFMGNGPNIVLLNFPLGVLSTNQNIGVPTTSLNPSYEPYDYRFDFNSGKVYAKITNTPGSSVQIGQPISYFRIKINPFSISLTNGFTINSHTYYSSHYPDGYPDINNPGNPDYELYNTFFEPGGNPYSSSPYRFRNILYCDDLNFCVDGNLPLARMAGPNSTFEEEIKIQFYQQTIEIHSKDQNIKQISLVNILGQEVFTNALTNPLRTYYLNTKSLNLPPGVYIVRVNNKEDKKIIIE